MKNNKIRVCVFLRSGRKNYEAQWQDPVTGKKKTRNTGKSRKSEAIRVAAVIEAELREGRYEDPASVTWDDFRLRFENEVLLGQAERTANLYATSFNAVERLIDPKLLSALDAAQISRFQELLRRNGSIRKKPRDNTNTKPKAKGRKNRETPLPLSESTIKTYLTHLRAALRWAKSVDLLDEVPSFRMPKRTGGMKGRAINLEEFERMLGKTEDVVGTAAAESWRYLLRGLWWSGLRLGEALALHWTDDREICVDFDSRRPMFLIRATADKAHKDRVLPMAPEFAKFLQQTPDELRRGYVFNPKPGRERVGRLRMDTVSKTIAKVGEQARVKVAEKGKRESDKVIKYASAHDLRRAFGFRWAMRVLPPVLKDLMRHKSIQTTMEYYVGRNAEATADAVWQAVEGTATDVESIATY